MSNNKNLTYNKRKNAIDGFLWICKKTCRFSSSVRDNSIFERCRLDMRIIFNIMYKYINRISFIDITYELGVDRGTVSEYCDLVREAICEFIASSNDILGGINDDGISKIVEIDKSLFLKRKYNR
ncbi:hypothetical protein DMUE_0470 [Dictyocoela muelleri]|nr:hypothetical protein DMUE_0470 [Dictyocoela muelleri]